METEDDESSGNKPDAPDPSRRFARAGWLFGRLLGLVFLIAFVSLHTQLDGLIGAHGITPARLVLEAQGARGFWDFPTLALFVGASDGALHALCVIGELVSLALLLGALSGPASLVASFIYLSLMNVGGEFFLFQWDALLVETGVLATLFLPWRLFDHPSRVTEPSPLARWAIYLLLFRLMFLSGYVKLASEDPAWASLTALDYHYWSQPLPSPFSWFVHQLPSAFHRVSTFLVLACEVTFPFLIFAGRTGRRAAFAGFSALMAIIAITGNYGFFNLLGLALALTLLDDGALDIVTRSRLTFLRSSDAQQTWLRRMAERPIVGPVLRWVIDALPWRAIGRWIRGVPALVLAFFGVVQIFVSTGGPQLLQESDPYAITDRDGSSRGSPLRRTIARAVEPLIDGLGVLGAFNAVNGYGLFAVMTVERREIRIEGSLDGRTWREYRFAHKPGDPTSIPGFSAPHMPRLDWQMWFAALNEDWRSSPWLVRFMGRLMQAQPEVLDLLEHDPFHGRRPRFLRATLYDYRFGDSALLMNEGKWWRVRKLRPYTPTFGR